MTVTLLEGHVVDVLAALPAGHFHTVVTSPPYLWLRSYGTAGQVWDGAEGCDHDWSDLPYHPKREGGKDFVDGGKVKLQEYKGTPYTAPGAVCRECGAWRGELGGEPSPELYVEHLVAVFRAVKRVLRADGALWVNLAGCYYNDPGGQNGTQGAVSSKAIEANGALGRQKRGRHPWLKPLDWVDVPGLFARAMQQDGWTWRSDVTWIKPSALPESVAGTRWERCKTKAGRIPVAEHQASGQKVPAGWDVGEHTHDRIPGGRYDTAAQTMQEWADCPGCPRCEKTDGLVLRRGSGRPTKATERILLFTRGPGYYFDQEAVREPHSPMTTDTPQRQRMIAEGKFSTARDFAPSLVGSKGGVGERMLHLNEAGRNLRDWWVIGPEPLKDAHYAAYPSALPERCIKAGTSEWGACGAMVKKLRLRPDLSEAERELVYARLGPRGVA